MSPNMEQFIKKFRIEELIIYETRYWTWSLRPIQSTLGAGVLSLKRECGVFSELSVEEFCDLNNIIKVIEHTLKSTFNYDIINYMMLMMVDKQVHYHILPRYENSIDFLGVIWKDLGWPSIPNLDGEVVDSDVLNNILNKIKSDIIV